MHDNQPLRMEHCQAFYEKKYAQAASRQDPAALETVLHLFLNGSPSSKTITRGDRAQGLAAAMFWSQHPNITDSRQLRFAISQLLLVQTTPVHFIQAIAAHDAELLRWAIRYARLFEQPESPVYLHIRQHYQSDDWLVFFAVCDRLLQQLTPYQQAIGRLHKQLSFMTLTDLLCYLSVLGWQQYLADAFGNTRADCAPLFERVLQAKLKSIPVKTLQTIGEPQIIQSVRQHLMPLLLPNQYPRHTHTQCTKNLSAVAELLAHTQELIDYEGSVDWFCYGDKCRYQWLAQRSVLFDEDESEKVRWAQTGKKSDLLWHYWLNRGIDTVVQSSLAALPMGAPEHQDAHITAVAKSFRSSLHLQVVYGIGETVTLEGDIELPLVELFLPNELHSALFAREYARVLFEDVAKGASPERALRDLMMHGFFSGENRLPFSWSTFEAKNNRIQDWFLSEPAGAGRLAKAKAVLQFWSLSLAEHATQLQEDSRIPSARLHEQPYLQLGALLLQLPWLMADTNHLTAAVNHLRRLNSRRPTLNTETQRAEQLLAQHLRQLGFAVVLGYRPAILADEDVGEIDIICQKDGVVLLLEMKTGYVRGRKAEIWRHRHTTLRKAAWQLTRKSAKFGELLNADPALGLQLGLAQGDYCLHSWIVDTCIEFDGVFVDGFQVVSREVLEVVMRDEMHLLCRLEQREALEEQKTSLFPAGFSAGRFVEVIENQSIWRQLQE